MITSIPFDTEAVPYTLFIGGVCILIGLLNFNILSIYLKKRKKPTLYLFLGINFWFIGILGFLIGLISWWIINNRILVYDLSLPWGYSCIVASGFFFLLFALEIFNPKNKRNKNLTIYIYLIYAVLLIISLFNFKGNEWGIEPPIPMYRMINLILIVLGQSVLYAMLMINTYGLIKRVEGEENKTRLKYIFYFYTFLLSFFIMYVVNEVVLMFVSNPPPFGPLEFVAWGLGVLGVFFARLSFSQQNKTDK